MTKKKNQTNWVYASTPQGRRRHGFIKGNRFVRYIDSKYVRWSDASFCLNTSVIDRLLDYSVAVIQFRHRITEKLKIYEIDLARALKYEIKKNEYGEENIRIPIEDCRLIKIKGIPVAEDGEDS